MRVCAISISYITAYAHSDCLWNPLIVDMIDALYSSYPGTITYIVAMVVHRRRYRLCSDKLCENEVPMMLGT